MIDRALVTRKIADDHGVRFLVALLSPQVTRVQIVSPISQLMTQWQFTLEDTD